MKFINSLIIIIIGLMQFSINAKLIIKCDHLNGKWGPIAVNCHKVEDSMSKPYHQNPHHSSLIRPIYFTPDELLYKNLSYGNFPIQEDKKSSKILEGDFEKLRSPASK
ncbi:hypothetical protein [Bacteriovorax sp. DB6_IX]|uniref:hypothetical protein n=1 Tax=Bacteriovorax sp. DB6_IX TaxID=1353530 RepID=UPI000418DDDE|nr:hypothetical protein [Bacteriovorax sp. DB6_IX]